ncbi:ABC-2 type transport system permease protein [Rhizobium tibeticum]|uniref:ABC transporter permease n=1 Tax=Rhizobium tibeticum TaxID=501024 RepID=UPI0027873245|nr:ABC-2 family transporter protein [Rhizobium tibeticum]MDP9811194.1 ABC-2 type transport system permease protein [Rhizobium tibeticum]
MQTQFVYRSQFWAGLFGELAEVAAKIAIWNAVLGSGTDEGASFSEMIAYALIAGTVMFAWRPGDMIREVGAAIRTGDITVHMLRPVRYPLYLFAVEIGNLAFRLMAVALPVTAIVAATYGIKLPTNPLNGGLFLCYWGLSFCIIFLLALNSALMSFWLMDAEAIDWFLNGIISFLSGSIVPFWFFPDALARIAAWLPFAWISYYPAAVYLERLPPASAMTTFAIGCAWAALLAFGAGFLWRRAAHRLVVQGG